LKTADTQFGFKKGLGCNYGMGELNLQD